MSAGPEIAEVLTTRLIEFVGALRLKGVTVGPSESVDAARVLEILGMDDREQLREGLAAALIRRGGQRDLFDMTFDLFFPLALGRSQQARDAPDDLDAVELRELLAMALAENDARTLGQVAEIAVDVLGEVGQPGTNTAGWSAYQTLDRLQPQTLLVQALQLRGGSGGGSTPGMAGSDFTARLERDEIRQNIDRFRDMVSAEARRRTAEVRGREVVTRHSVRTGKNRIDFLSANAEQLAELRRTIAPLSRKLATRLSARRRRRRRGAIDIRRTLRRAMGTGGVPIRPVFAKPSPTRPELVLLCDVSGSVSGFSSFTMLLVRALSEQFSKIRVFAFVNAMTEVTDIVKDSDDPSARIMSEARVTKWHTSSDYGEAFLDFVELHMRSVGPRTAVLILGDARNNNQNPQFGALHEIADRAKRTFWLNPEPSSRWGLGDSVATQYADIVPMYECCNVDQLSAFIGRLLPV